MSINLPTKQQTVSLSDPRIALWAAAQGLWGRLLSATFAPEKLIRLTAPVSQSQEFWRVAAMGSTATSARFYWQDRHKYQTLLGLGVALEVRRNAHRDLPEVWQLMQSITQGTSAQFFGGVSFADCNGTEEWDGFDAVRFSLPLVELSEVEGKVFLSTQLYCQTQDDWQTQLESIRQILASFNRAATTDMTRSFQSDTTRYLTSPADWKVQVDQVLKRIHEEDFSKVVLARSTEHKLAGAVTDFKLAERWQRQTPQTYTFLMNFGKQSFIGFSPERLLRRKGTEFATESLAGTQPRGQTSAKDAELEEILMRNPKLRHEHQIVTDYIASRLAPFTRHCVADAEVNVLKLANVQHRQAGFRGKILKQTDFPKLFLSLFPTPAVCGLPKQAAYYHILEHEGFQRGWYAGAVGVFGAEECEFSVAIRSALLAEDRIISFAGAGIVEGSEAESEWSELNDKASIIESILT